MVNLKGKDFLKLLDFSAEEIGYLIDLASELKAKKKAGIMLIDISKQEKAFRLNIPRKSLKP